MFSFPWSVFLSNCVRILITGCPLTSAKQRVITEIYNKTPGWSFLVFYQSWLFSAFPSRCLPVTYFHSLSVPRYISPEEQYS